MSTIYVDSWPRQINVHGGILSNPSPEQCREHGYELKTDEMREAERQAAAQSIAQGFGLTEEQVDAIMRRARRGGV